jgi:hypothetical protein
VSAGSALLDRGWGSDPQSHVGEHGGDIRIVIRQIIRSVSEQGKLTFRSFPQ